MRVGIVRTGLANLASVCAAIERCGGTPEIALKPADLGEVTHMVLPGVGSFGAAAQSLRKSGFDVFIHQWVDAGRPLLAICVGMQILFERSEEDPGAIGLGILKGHIGRIGVRKGLRVPHMGWNRIQTGEHARVIDTGLGYFANSYAALQAPKSATSATTTYGQTFVSAISRGRLLACQFHPELSGTWGQALIERWLLGQHADTKTVHLPTASATTLLPRVVPCLDVRDGRVVKGVRFQNLRDAGDPVEAASNYEQQGADELVILDVTATAEGRAACIETVRAVRSELSIPITVGGGVRSQDDARNLLDAGADKVAVNSAAVNEPSLIGAISGQFGRQCAILAIDAARDTTSPSGYEVVIHAGTGRTGIDVVEWACEATKRGAGEILLTSIDRDGTKDGYDLDLINRVAGAVDVPLIASGGAATAAHLKQAILAGATAVLAASIFHDRMTTVSDIKRQLQELGCEVRQ